MSEKKKLQEAIALFEAGRKYSKSGTIKINLNEDGYDVVLSALREKLETPRDWTPCSDGINLPENKKEVLLSCVGYNKREYVCKGYYIEKHKEEIGAADDIEPDWDEETDTNFLPEGFYECIANWGDYSFVYINDTVIAWQPLPSPYRADDTTGKVKEDEFMREAMYDQLHSNGN